MATQIKKYVKDQEYFFEEGCFINELLNTEADENLSIARATVKPGETTKWHRLVDTVERYLILKGCGRVEVGELEATDVGPWDTVIIKAGDRQRIKNTGQEELVFLAICTPRFRPENYIDDE